MGVTAARDEVLTRYRRREIREADLALIREKVAEVGPSGGRMALARSICEAWDWRQPSGTLATPACRDLLLRLEEWGHIQLPAPKRAAGAPRRKHHPVLPHDLIPLAGLALGAQDVDLSALTVRPIAAEEREGWRLYMGRYHYLGCRAIVGEHLLYAATVGEDVVALLAWASSAFRAPLREKYIGWDEAAKSDRLHLVADNVRFLVFPWVRVPHLASKVLATNLRRLSADWEQAWGHPIYLAETFVDTARFRGTCYRASNWIYLGQTAGRSKRGNAYLHEGTPKALFVYPLHRRAQRLLAGERLDRAVAPADEASVGASAATSPVDAKSATPSSEEMGPRASLEMITTALASIVAGPTGTPVLPTAATGRTLPVREPRVGAPVRALRGRKKTSLQIVLSDVERDALERRSRGLAIPHREVVRAKIILLLAAGGTPSAVAHAVGSTRRIVHKWGKRFVKKRLEGLVDDERSGRPPRFSPRGGDPIGQAGLRAP